MKEVVIFGGGSVGRGFVGEICSDAGMRVRIFDMQASLIEGINKDEGYLHFTISNSGRSEKWIKPAHADFSSNQAAVNEAILQADLIASSVGAGVLPKIMPALAEALEARIKTRPEPINILLCENLHGVAALTREWLHSYLKDISTDLFDEKVGLLTTSIGRMIPVATDELLALHPAAIQVEPYKFLPYDIHAVKGEMPDVPYLHGEAEVDFNYYADRKLYVHNMGHSMCAYLAEYFDYEYISEAINDSQIRYFVHQAMNESAHALAKKYGQNEDLILAHVGDLLFRFSNKLLYDTAERVGRDPKRKTARGDRFLGAFEMCLETGSECQFVSLALAAGLRKLQLEFSYSDEEVFEYLNAQEFSLLAEGGEKMELLKKQYQALADGFDFSSQLALINEKYHVSKIV